jgi:hypothetical protein
MYIGKTVRTLASRMYGYQKPGPTQLTSPKNHDNIRGLLQQGKSIEIYVLVALRAPTRALGGGAASPRRDVEEGPTARAVTGILTTEDD